MGPLNKERIACLVAVVIALYGLATAFSGQGLSGSVPEVPAPRGEIEVPPMNMAKVEFLVESFDVLWAGDARNPWIPPKETSRPTARTFPMQEPQLGTFSTVVPAPPFAPRERKRPVIRQFRRPASIEGISPDPGTGENEE